MAREPADPPEPERHKGEPVLAFASQGEWEAWLAEEHERSNGIWLKIAKRDVEIASVTHPQALEAALCFGWIDGQRNRFDEQWFLQRFTPRRAASRWSEINRDSAVRLIEAGRMRPAGLREVERAKGDGRWQAAYAGQRTATMPDDLHEALEREPEAMAFFETLDSRNRYAVLYRVQDAKRAETRARRIATFVEMLARGEKPHP